MLTTISTTALYFNGSSNAYVSGAEETLITPASGTGWDFDVRNFGPAVSFNVDNFETESFQDSTSWNLEFAAPEGEVLAVGEYELAGRYPFQGAAQPGFRFGGDGRGNNQLSAKFNVLEATYDETGDIASFAADFIQFGEVNFSEVDGAAFDWGSIRYNSEIALTAEPIEYTTQRLGEQGDAPFSFFVTSAGGNFRSDTDGAAIGGYPWQLEFPESFDNTLFIKVDGPTTFDIELVAPNGAPLAPGVYAGMEGSPFQSEGAPGFSLYGDYQARSDIAGHFEILEIETDETGAVTALAVDFLVGSPNGESDDLMWASLRYNTDEPLRETPDLAPSVPEGENGSPEIFAPVTLKVEENETDVISLNAIDVEGDDLTYAIDFENFGGIDGEKFEIGTDGVLRFIDAPDFETPHDGFFGQNTYEVAVSVTDGNSPASSSAFLVEVTDVDETVPVEPPVEEPTEPPVTAGEGLLRGFVFEDTNGNGTYENDDPRLAGVAVDLIQDGAVIASTLTGSTGNYNFRDVAFGEYQLGFEAVDGLSFVAADQGEIEGRDSDVTDAAAGTTDLFTVDSAAPVALQAGLELARTGDVRGMVFKDLDGNGYYSGADERLQGETVNLYEANGNLVASTTTGFTGNFQFNDTAFGDYQLEFDGGEFGFVAAGLGPREGRDSDVIAAGRTNIFSVEDETVYRFQAGIEVEDLAF